MKSFKIFSLIAILSASSFVAMAQDLKTETIAVAGNCGMCKTNIEKAAKTAGATEANWDMDKKTVTVSYNTLSTSAAKIEQSIAAAGYDTRNVRATDASYKKLHACCQYERGDKTSKEGAKTATSKSCCAETH